MRDSMNRTICARDGCERPEFIAKHGQGLGLEAARHFPRHFQKQREECGWRQRTHSEHSRWSHSLVKLPWTCRGPSTLEGQRRSEKVREGQRRSEKVREGPGRGRCGEITNRLVLHTGEALEGVRPLPLTARRLLVRRKTQRDLRICRRGAIELRAGCAGKKAVEGGGHGGDTHLPPRCDRAPSECASASAASAARRQV